MALQLMKLAISATTSTIIYPENSRFFYVTTAVTEAEDTLKIDAASFFRDDGSAVTTLPTLNANNNYYNVYINGVLQMEGISTYIPGATGVGSLDISVPAGANAILVGTPVILELVQFTPNATTIVTA
ncbi:DUF4183 domain-containing protein [Bacillus thuringiensis]|uniref:DUF4183 domain-containing protein n=1 Tax=Bacillus cereus group TaxID=86661 RepID=UPI0032F88E4E|nr:DUF4183 domain-containing protein [Bacillus cereus]HDR8116360.1 DUF4183 domain-containing protein [Bacillus cereus]